MKTHLLALAIISLVTVAGVAQAGSKPQRTPSVRTDLTAAERGKLVGQLVRQWGPYVQTIYGTSVAVWAKRMAPTFSAASNANLLRASSLKTFQGMVGALTGQTLTDGRVTTSLATQAQVLGSTANAALLGSATADLVYTPLAPCRIADTRSATGGGPIPGGSTRSFRGYTASDFRAQGGYELGDCGIPANPAALMINVAAPVPSSGGFLTVYPFGTTRPLASNLDYKAGDLANNEMAAKMTTGSATAEFTIYAHGTTDVAIDVVGYFMAPVATALNCMTAVHTADYAPVPDDGLASRVDAPLCADGYSRVSVECLTSDSEVVVNQTDNDGCWVIDKDPGNGITNSAQAASVCCGIPGR